MKINELIVGESYTITLVVKSATARSTKANKPYLSLEFFDGTNTISGNYWDWVSGNKPEANTVVDVTAQVTEWQGVKQLNVKSMAVNTAARIEDFAPKSGYDIGEVYKKAYALMSDVCDDELRTVVLSILEEAKELWLTVPAASRVHHNYIGGTLLHSYNVAVKAKALAEVTEGANVDLATVGGMLHDVGKLFTYTINGVNIDTTANGRLYEHVFIGAEFVGNFAENHVDVDDPYVYSKIRLLRHIILSHHGILEFGSPVTPQCLEAYIVNHADSLDAAAEQIKAASANSDERNIWTEKLWALSNKPHLTAGYVEAIMNRKTV